MGTSSESGFSNSTRAGKLFTVDDAPRFMRKDSLSEVGPTMTKRPTLFLPHRGEGRGRLRGKKFWGPTSVLGFSLGVWPGQFGH